MINTNRIKEVIREYSRKNVDVEDMLYPLFYDVFQIDPIKYKLIINKKNERLYYTITEPITDFENNLRFIDRSKFTENLLKNEETFQIEYFSDYNLKMIFGNDFLYTYIGSSSYSNDSPNPIRITIIVTSPKVVKRIIRYLEPAEHSREYSYYVTWSDSGFKTKALRVKHLDLKINDNYNDDLPINKITNFVNGDSAGVALFYGKPGTGKSSLIKHLIANSDVNFYLMESELLANATNNQFVKFLFDECSGGVIVLEDCEKLLMSRDNSYNQNLSSFLNLADGMLGDALNVKFICTFNTELNNIDKALLRKGRLKIKYEFKELNKEKAVNLANKLGINIPISKAMSLADIYNLEEVVEFSKEEAKKIGF